MFPGPLRYPVKSGRLSGHRAEVKPCDQDRLPFVVGVPLLPRVIQNYLWLLQRQVLIWVKKMGNGNKHLKEFRKYKDLGETLVAGQGPISRLS